MSWRNKTPEQIERKKTRKAAKTIAGHVVNLYAAIDAGKGRGFRTYDLEGRPVIRRIPDECRLKPHEVEALQKAASAAHTIANDFNGGSEPWILRWYRFSADSQHFRAMGMVDELKVSGKPYYATLLTSISTIIAGRDAVKAVNFGEKVEVAERAMGHIV